MTSMAGDWVRIVIDDGEAVLRAGKMWIEELSRRKAVRMK